MPNELKKSLFFPGGRILYPGTLDETQGLKLTANGDGSWTVTLNATITEPEAKDMIKRYKDFELKDINTDNDFTTAYPNQVYFEAFTDETATTSKNIAFKNIEMSILRSHKAEDEGQIILRMIPVDGIGKTQNGSIKTQNDNVVVAGG
jgi:hypothetical protein